jgi:hypothetical protein
MSDDKKSESRAAEYLAENARFKAGNPGRPKGSRNKLANDFVKALHEDFEQHGAQAIAKVREEDTSTYIRVIASILPKELKVESASALTDQQLSVRIRELANLLEDGVAGASGGSEEAEGSTQTH